MDQLCLRARNSQTRLCTRNHTVKSSATTHLSQHRSSDTTWDAMWTPMMCGFRWWVWKLGSTTTHRIRSIPHGICCSLHTCRQRTDTDIRKTTAKPFETDGGSHANKLWRLWQSTEKPCIEETSSRRLSHATVQRMSTLRAQQSHAP